jgi:hypothetical protein
MSDSLEASMMKRIGELKAENARLKAEVENSKRINTELLVLSNRQASDIRFLTKVGEWQPIQTAPKNYTKIICLWPIKTAYRDSKGYWCRDEMDWWDKHEGELPEPIFWKHLPEGWKKDSKKGGQP